MTLFGEVNSGEDPGFLDGEDQQSLKLQVRVW